MLGLASGSAASREAAGLVLGGPFTALFWVGVVGLGLVMPLVIQMLAVTHRVQHTAVAPILVMAGRARAAVRDRARRAGQPLGARRLGRRLRWG